MPVRRAAAAFRRLAADARRTSVLLLIATAVALLWANGPWASTYDVVWHAPRHVGGATVTWHAVVSDGLMTLFFLVVGLEIVREFATGTLRTPRAAAVPIAAALGGMLVPAFCYAVIAHDTPFLGGWGIPMATDIAFAVGLLGVLAPGAPSAVRAFLMALAIVDDLGAIAVIAVAYAAPTEWRPLVDVAVCTLVLFALRRVRVSALWPYLLVTVLLWWTLHRVGIHPSLAGVILAAALPLGAREDGATTADRGVHSSPSVRVEHAVAPWVATVVLPLFALANAGVSLRGMMAPDAPIVVLAAVVVGLVLGKPLGIVAATWCASRLRIAALPDDLSWRWVLVAGAFGGIGFTMSLFVRALAFTGSGSAAAARTATGGVLLGSLLAAVSGALLVRWARRDDAPHARNR